MSLQNEHGEGKLCAYDRLPKSDRPFKSSTPSGELKGSRGVYAHVLQAD